MGGHYAYAEVPAGDWVRDRLGWERNLYDRLGHLVQGFVPAVLVREPLVRTPPSRGGRWLAPLTVCARLAFSAVFEVLERLAAVTGGEAADAFLGTQGTPGTPSGTCSAPVTRATCALLLLSRVRRGVQLQLTRTSDGSRRLWTGLDCEVRHAGRPASSGPAVRVLTRCSSTAQSGSQEGSRKP
ncbi:hypothetical protein STTU_1002 [Streptomyces sp. Tu6071]|nr:hypothetical protein STTU_1002 [Streptomyces sp. Tu6071]